MDKRSFGWGIAVGIISVAIVMVAIHICSSYRIVEKYSYDNYRHWLRVYSQATMTVIPYPTVIK